MQPDLQPFANTTDGLSPVSDQQADVHDGFLSHDGLGATVNLSDKTWLAQAELSIRCLGPRSVLIPARLRQPAPIHRPITKYTRNLEIAQTRLACIISRDRYYDEEHAAVPLSGRRTLGHPFGFRKNTSLHRYLYANETIAIHREDGH